MSDWPALPSVSSEDFELVNSLVSGFYLPLDGSDAMQGNLDMGGYSIILSSLTSDIYGNWDGAVPANLASVDAVATKGFYLDSSAGSGQFMENVWLGGKISTTNWDGTGDPEQGLRILPADNTRAETADHASLDITGDVTLVVHANIPSNGAAHTFVKKGDSDATSSAYSFGPWSAGTGLVFSSSQTGLDLVTVAITTGTPYWYAMTLDVNNGAGGHDIKAWGSTTGAAGTWSQLGSTVTTAGTITLDTNALALRVDDGSTADETIYEVQVWDGLRDLNAGTGGTLVANPKFDDPTEWPDNGPNADSLGRTWTLYGSAYIDISYPDATVGFILDGDRGFGQIAGNLQVSGNLDHPSGVFNDRVAVFDTQIVGNAGAVLTRLGLGLDDADTYITSDAADILSIYAGGNHRLGIHTDGIRLYDGTYDPAIWWGDSTWTSSRKYRLWRDDANFDALKLSGTNSSGTEKDFLIFVDAGIQSAAIRDATTGSAANVFINATSGGLARSTSLLAHKTDVDENVGYLANVDLRPTKHYRPDDNRWRYGLVADWLAEQDPLFGEYGADGSLSTYDTRAILAVLAAKINQQERRIAQIETTA